MKVILATTFWMSVKRLGQLLSCIGMALLASSLLAAENYFEVTYPAAAEIVDIKKGENWAGDLQFGVTYTVWIPPGVKTLRGVIVHQHGCGGGACDGGKTAAYDLHWQALARKWDCALLGPSYRQADQQNCRLWCDPRNGSGKAFLKGLADLAEKSHHPELTTVPWCLWGHSGGGFWASLMQVQHPERIVGIWFRSGTAYETWEKGDVPKPEIPAAAYQVPMVCNPGIQEKDDDRFKGAWTGALSMFKAYRARGGLIAFTPDPKSNHDCRESRYLAIPFFDACLEARLPEKGSQTQQLRQFDQKQAWLVKLHEKDPEPVADFKGNVDEASWLPNEKYATAWYEYNEIGTVLDDETPPPAPTNVVVTRQEDGSVLVTWEGEADFETGLEQFLILRGGKQVARVPEKLHNQRDRPHFQGISFHDTPLDPLTEMRFVDKSQKFAAGEKLPTYQVKAVNTVGRKSAPSK